MAAELARTIRSAGNCAASVARRGESESEWTVIGAVLPYFHEECRFPAMVPFAGGGDGRARHGSDRDSFLISHYGVLYAT
jgi:hypothetical protein